MSIKELKILWGENPEQYSETSHYRFDTEKELNAFLYGIEQAQGWHGFNVLPRELKTK